MAGVMCDDPPLISLSQSDRWNLIYGTRKRSSRRCQRDLLVGAQIFIDYEEQMLVQIRDRLNIGGVCGELLILAERDDEMQTC